MGVPPNHYIINSNRILYFKPSILGTLIFRDLGWRLFKASEVSYIPSNLEVYWWPHSPYCPRREILEEGIVFSSKSGFQQIFHSSSFIPFEDSNTNFSTFWLLKHGDFSLPCFRMRRAAFQLGDHAPLGLIAHTATCQWLQWTSRGFK